MISSGSLWQVPAERATECNLIPAVAPVQRPPRTCDPDVHPALRSHVYALQTLSREIRRPGSQRHQSQSAWTCGSLQGNCSIILGICQSHMILSYALDFDSSVCDALRKRTSTLAEDGRRFALCPPHTRRMKRPGGPGPGDLPQPGSLMPTGQRRSRADVSGVSPADHGSNPKVALIVMYRC